MISMGKIVKEMKNYSIKYLGSREALEKKRLRKGLFHVSNPLSGASSLSSLTRDRVDVQLIVTESGEQDVDKLEYQKPAYVAVALIMGLTIFAVLFPLFVTSNYLGMSTAIYSADPPPPCNDSCKIVITESIPENITYPAGSPVSPSTFSTWQKLIGSATQSIDMAVFYWTLRGQDIHVTDPSTWQGEEIFKALSAAAKNPDIKMRIAQNQASDFQPQLDSKELQKLGASVRNLNFSRWFHGNGILHTKLWIIDQKHLYVGSANMDWRSLSQVKELGAAVYDCPCLAADMSKLFSVYWDMGAEHAQIPDHWPAQYATKFNEYSPMAVQLNNTPASVFISSSPRAFCPRGRTSDIDSILHVMASAQKYIYVAVMDYFPTTLYTKPRKFWTVIDDALRTAAFDRGVEVRVMASWWNHSRADLPYYLRSLRALTGVHGAKGTVNIQVKLFHVPTVTPAQAQIPFARVNHNKYMVTDNTAYIGTSNWSGDYFLYTGGIGLIINQTATNPPISGQNSSAPTMQQQLSAIFERDWNSQYALPVEKALQMLPGSELKGNSSISDASYL